MNDSSRMAVVVWGIAGALLLGCGSAPDFTDAEDPGEGELSTDAEDLGEGEIGKASSALACDPYEPGYQGDFDTDNDGVLENVYIANGKVTITELTCFNKRSYTIGSGWTLTHISNLNTNIGTELVFANANSQIMIFSEPNQYTYSMPSSATLLMFNDLDGYTGNELLYYGTQPGATLGYQWVFAFRNGTSTQYSVPNYYAYIGTCELDGVAGNEVMWNAGYSNPGTVVLLNQAKKQTKTFSVPGNYAYQSCLNTDTHTGSEGNEIVWLSKKISGSTWPNAVLTLNYNRGTKYYDFGGTVLDVYGYGEMNSMPGSEILMKVPYTSTVKAYVDEYNNTIVWY